MAGPQTGTCACFVARTALASCLVLAVFAVTANAAITPRQERGVARTWYRLAAGSEHAPLRCRRLRGRYECSARLGASSSRPACRLAVSAVVRRGHATVSVSPECARDERRQRYEEQPIECTVARAKTGVLTIELLPRDRCRFGAVGCRQEPRFAPIGYGELPPAPIFAVTAGRCIELQARWLRRYEARRIAYEADGKAVGSLLEEFDRRLSGVEETAACREEEQASIALEPIPAQARSECVGLEEALIAELHL